MWKLIELFVTAPDTTKEAMTIYDTQKGVLQEYLNADYEPFQIEQVPSGTYYYLRKHMHGEYDSIQ